MSPAWRVSLTTRLTAFFLVALAAVLVGFSATLWVLAREYLHRQVDERLQATLQTLVASIEFNPTGLEWEPNQQLAARHFNKDGEAGHRVVALPQGPGLDQVRWVVRDGRTGAVVDRSLNLGDDANLRLASDPSRMISAATTLRREHFGGVPWRIAERRVVPIPLPTHSRDEGDAGPHHPTLILSAGLSLVPVKLALLNLARVLAGLSLVVWLIAAVLGRGLCRRALVPVTQMAEAARAMGAADLDQRLPASTTGDELQDLGDAFNDLLDRLHEAFERQRRFTGDASHQLRTPLAALLGQVEVSLRRERSTDDLRRVLALVRDQAAHLSQIVEALLFLARADAEAALPGREAIDLTQWIDTHLERWSTHPRAADLVVVNETAGLLPICVQVHPPLLAQLLDNLLDNAFKYSEPGTPVTIRLGRASGKVMLSVEDQGRGIDPTDLPRIFEPFYRAPSSRREGRAGTGLGLAVAHRIAGALDGSLSARSEPGQGSRFTFWLHEVSHEGSVVRIG
jgi:signal transduction histidine kinase